jgi:anaerobic selenocysteine-containing dehydrogenase/Fe-S-cluster-containing dehydrogenase component
MKRRTFLKMAGLGSISFTGCTSRPDKKLYALLHAPEDTVTGQASWYASTCRECPAGCGILAKNREGRIIKIEGNPLHPINKGKLCMRGQAALQGVYHPDRIRTPLLKNGNVWKAISHAQAIEIVVKKTLTAAEKGENEVRMITGVVGETLLQVFSRAMAQWHSDGPLIFEPFAYESLRTANQKIFGVDGLISCRMEKADMLVSFGADFLETWLSPVEYAGKFKTMHTVQNGQKGIFFHIGPYRSLTGANSDCWLACRPGTEIFIALGMIRELLENNENNQNNDESRNRLKKICAPYTADKVVQMSGASPSVYRKLISHLKNAGSPLILGTGAVATGPHGLHTDMAANIANRLLDPGVALFNFNGTHRVETAHRRSRVADFFNELRNRPPEVLFIHQSNPLFSLPESLGVKSTLEHTDVFTICFSNVMDETAAVADLVIPVAHTLESWDEYAGRSDVTSIIQPTMGRLYKAPDIGDLFLKLATPSEKIPDTMKGIITTRVLARKGISGRPELIRVIQRGGVFEPPGEEKNKLPSAIFPRDCEQIFADLSDSPAEGVTFAAIPSIRFFDGRSAASPWMGEIPDPMTKVAWQSPVMIHPETAKTFNIRHGESVRITSPVGDIASLAYETDNVVPGLLAMEIGQGHFQCGRYARNVGTDPIKVLSGGIHPVSGGPRWDTSGVSILQLKTSAGLAHTDGSRYQFERNIALTTPFTGNGRQRDDEDHGKPGLAMNDFPLALPIPRGYNTSRDFYPSHDHADYRWAMAVDLDRCIGCNACAAACYAENNIAVSGLSGILEGREMSWLRVERYHIPDRANQDRVNDVIFFPMMCQHCDNAPCESVCPVYAPHHSKEGLNNQVYNRCIGTRFCSQNCPYKVRRFNWFERKWPEPMNLQLNPEVTVRRKGVMEKCSFCVQRIKAAHGVAKDEDRKIKDGEVVPACAQTCPTEALVFGNLMDPKSRISKMVESPRAYQAMGYLNTKPAVIYLKKVVWEI